MTCLILVNGGRSSTLTSLIYLLDLRFRRHCIVYCIVIMCITLSQYTLLLRGTMTRQVYLAVAAVPNSSE